MQGGLILFKGENSLVLNQSTMREAVQLWLNKQLLDANKILKVTKVEKTSTTFNADEFTVTLVAEEEEDDL